MYACMHLFMYASVQACQHASMHVCRCMYVYTHILIFFGLVPGAPKSFFFSLFTSPFNFLEGFAGLGLLGYPSIIFLSRLEGLNRGMPRRGFPGFFRRWIFALHAETFIHIAV